MTQVLESLDSSLENEQLFIINFMYDEIFGQPINSFKRLPRAPFIQLALTIITTSLANVIASFAVVSQRAAQTA